MSNENNKLCEKFKLDFDMDVNVKLEYISLKESYVSVNKKEFYKINNTNPHILIKLNKDEINKDEITMITNTLKLTYKTLKKYIKPLTNKTKLPTQIDFLDYIEKQIPTQPKEYTTTIDIEKLSKVNPYQKIITPNHPIINTELNLKVHYSALITNFIQGIMEQTKTPYEKHISPGTDGLISALKINNGTYIVNTIKINKKTQSVTHTLKYLEPIPHHLHSEIQKLLLITEDISNKKFRQINTEKNIETYKYKILAEYPTTFGLHQYVQYINDQKTALNHKTIKNGIIIYKEI